MSADVQYGVQTLVNAGRRSEYWRFDDDYPLRDSARAALNDQEEAIRYGYAAEYVRVVAIRVITPDEHS